MAAVVEIVAELRTVSPTSPPWGCRPPGSCRADRRHVLFAPHLSGATSRSPTCSPAGSGLPVVIENDANAAAWAEFRFGAGQRRRRPADGRDRHRRRWRARPRRRALPGRARRRCRDRAHQLRPRRAALSLRSRGAASSSTPRKRSPTTRPARPLRRRGRPGCWPAAGGDRRGGHRSDGDRPRPGGRRRCDGALGRSGRDLGPGIASLVAVLDPSLVVLGGGVSEAGELLRLPSRGALADHITGGTNRPGPRVMIAALGNEAALVGVGRPRPQGHPGATDRAQRHSVRVQVAPLRWRATTSTGASPGLSEE